MVCHNLISNIFFKVFLMVYNGTSQTPCYFLKGEIWCYAHFADMTTEAQSRARDTVWMRHCVRAAGVQVPTQHGPVSPRPAARGAHSLRTSPAPRSRWTFFLLCTSTSIWAKTWVGRGVPLAKSRQLCLNIKNYHHSSIYGNVQKR